MYNKKKELVTAYLFFFSLLFFYRPFNERKDTAGMIVVNFVESSASRCTVRKLQTPVKWTLNFVSFSVETSTSLINVASILSWRTYFKLVRFSFIFNPTTNFVKFHSFNDTFRNAQIYCIDIDFDSLTAFIKI